MVLSIDAKPNGQVRLPPPVPLIRSSDIVHAERHVSLGRLVRVRRGVLATASSWSALKPWERYLARVYAVAMTYPDVVFTHESAAAILGLPIFGEPREVHVLDTPRATARVSGGIRIHTTAADRVILDVGGILVTSASDVAIDLASFRHRAVGLAVADAALRSDPLLTVEALVAANEGRLSSRGRRVARWALHRASPLAETALESLSRAAIEWLGFGEPELQREFRTGDKIDRCDMWWPEARIVGEADGDVKYDGSLQPSSAAIRREKDRDRRLRHHADGIGHWGWADVAEVAPLRLALRQAGLRPIAPESSLELATLRSALRPPGAPGRETAIGHRE